MNNPKASSSHQGEKPTNPLGLAWPRFLDQLDSNPDAAFQGFYHFATQLMKICPPGICRSFDPAAKEDLVHDLILHCCQNDFRALRRYIDRGKPFAAWLQLVARNKVTDRYRKNSKAVVVPLTNDDDDRPDIDPPDLRPGADHEVDRKKILGLVQASLQALSSTCRLLIQGAAEGYKPRELVRLLGWPDEHNKKVSDDLRECRKRLRRVLNEEGLAENELKGLFGA